MLRDKRVIWALRLCHAGPPLPVSGCPAHDGGPGRRRGQDRGPAATCGCRRSSLLLGGILDLFPGLLQVALRLLGFALALEYGGADGLAGVLLGLALGRLDLVLGLI